jgi:branched-chain amino acid transport system ATP-binding protein
MKKITPQTIQVNNLSVNYGNIKAIKDISFQFRTSEITTLIGSNGAGKTTTLKALMGLLPSTGTVAVNDTRIEKLSVAHRISRGITLCPEGRGIFPNLTVFDNLMLGAYLNKNSSEIKHLLEEQLTFFPKLAERIKQIAGTLSGGEQQMLAISRALMSQPEFLLLDEPSLGLAPVIIDQIFSKFEDLKKQGLGLLIVEQNAILALEISDRAYVLETGTLTLSGSGAELLHDPRVIDAYLS